MIALLKRDLTNILIGKRTETVTSGEVTPIHLEQEMDQTEHAPNNREQNDTTSSDNVSSWE